MAKIRRALISVSDKTGIVELARELQAQGAEILSTGGTASVLSKGGVTVKDVSEHTGFPEMMDGRLKTLHPKIHGGLLGRRENKNDLSDMQAHGIEPIDIVVVNLYPFEATISREGSTFDDAIANIDIGGPTMLRSAAKNFRDVAVVTDPADYEGIISELTTMQGELGYKTRFKLALKVFEHTARYDALIASYFNGMSEESEEFPANLTMTYSLGSTLRYGENPHQRAAFYTERVPGSLSMADAEKIQGKDMSFNNYCDTQSALMLSLEFKKPACAIIKHNNPCGVAVGEDSAQAYVEALKTDPISAFGGVLAFNTEVGAGAATEITRIFVEVVIAPSYSEEALAIFATKPNIRVLLLRDMDKPLAGGDIKRIAGGILVQNWDLKQIDVRLLSAVTRRQPTAEELDAMEFSWKVAKHVKSNAIVYSHRNRTAGIGIGQTSRVYAAKCGAVNALESLSGTVVASDGFFPFRDGIDGIHKVGVTAVIQPGGSVNDEEVITACNELNMAMLFTGARHFKH